MSTWFLILWLAGYGKAPIEFSQTFATREQCEVVGEQWDDHNRFARYACLHVEG